MSMDKGAQNGRKWNKNTFLEPISGKQIPLFGNLLIHTPNYKNKSKVNMHKNDLKKRNPLIQNIKVKKVKKLQKIPIFL